MSILTFLPYLFSSPSVAFSWNHPLWWWPTTMLTIVWIILFYPSWLAKDRSMSRYPQWTQYTSQTGQNTRIVVTVTCHTSQFYVCNKTIFNDTFAFRFDPSLAFWKFLFEMMKNGPRKYFAKVVRLNVEKSFLPSLI